MKNFDCNNCANNKSPHVCYDCVSAIADDGSEITRPSHWESKYDNVNRPEHYQTKNGLETIDAIEAFTEILQESKQYVLEMSSNICHVGKRRMVSRILKKRNGTCSD